MTSPKQRFTRRDFLKIGSAGAAGLFLAACGPKDILTSTPTTAKLTPTACVVGTPAPGNKIIQPKVIPSSNKKLVTQLVVKSKEYTLPGQCTPVQLRMYGSPKAGISNPNPDNDSDWDWGFPGPTYRIKQDDVVNIKLYNHLEPNTQDPGACDPVTTPVAKTPPALTPTPYPTETYPECFHNNNVTNLHFHGFHVDQGKRSQDINFTPDDTRYGDDVFLALYPKGQTHVHEEKGIDNEIGEVEFLFHVPTTQAAGTHWYHPHSHGSTHLQVTNGMAGMFIVEDTLNDEFGNVKPEEYVLVIQDIAELVNFRGGGNNPLTMINGQIKPTITMKPGEIQRWRLVNATGKGSNIYNISIPDVPNADEPEIYLIAADGVFLEGDEWKKPVNNIYMAPGNRLDILVKAPANLGTFPMGAASIQIEKPADSGGGGGGGGGGKNKVTPTSAIDSPSSTDLVTIVVEGDPVVMNLPQKLPALNNNQRPFEKDEKFKQDTVAFSVLEGTSKTNAPIFLIDCKSFDPAVVDHRMILDTSEEWTITNSTNVAHPFHIHLNPFLIAEFHDPNGGLPDPGRRWQDTIIIPPALLDAKKQVVLGPDGKPKELGKVVIRHRFPDFVDKYVLHCHILGHEDRGMMQVVEVVTPEAYKPVKNGCDK